MKPRSIGIISPLGTNPKRSASNVSLQWLKCISAIENIHIEHARNRDERKIGQYFVDLLTLDENNYEIILFRNILFCFNSLNC